MEKGEARLKVLSCTIRDESEVSVSLPAQYEMNDWILTGHHTAAGACDSDSQLVGR